MFVHVAPLSVEREAPPKHRGLPVMPLESAYAAISVLPFAAIWPSDCVTWGKIPSPLPIRSLSAPP
jgi:hypothetical protein